MLRFLIYIQFKASPYPMYWIWVHPNFLVICGPLLIWCLKYEVQAWPGHLLMAPLKSKQAIQYSTFIG